MNIRQIKAREALLAVLSPGNELWGCTLSEAKATAAALAYLGFGPLEVYVAPMITGPVVVQKVPLSEVERYGLEDELLNYACATTTIDGFNLALLRKNFDQPAEPAFLMMFAEFNPGHTKADLNEATLAMPGVNEAIQAHIAKGQALAIPKASK